MSKKRSRPKGMLYAIRFWFEVYFKNRAYSVEEMNEAYDAEIRGLQNITLGCSILSILVSICILVTAAMR